MRLADALCVLLGAVAVALELLALWAIVSANARAQRQADAVVAAIQLSPAIEFQLQPQTLFRFDQRRQDGRSAVDRDNHEAVADGGVVATGTLVPGLSEDTGRLRFNGKMHVRRNVKLPSPPASTSSSSSSSSAAASSTWNEALDGREEQEMLVLKQQRGVRYALATDEAREDEEDAEAECLLPRDVPPLFTIEAASQSAFAAQSFARFGLDCKRGRPLEVVFDRSPFVLCVLDWFDALNSCVRSETRPSGGQPMLFPTSTAAAGKAEGVTTPVECSRAPPLVIYGENVVLKATLVFASTEADQSADEARAIADCQLLEAPLATASLASQSVLFHLLPRPTLTTTTNASDVAQLSPLM